ncbi:Asp-tRNA(Asn)/Glu-tRNA(Gln) amidotransferase subunit GatC [bacterium]|nr:Asp-tRNA(Asn)/Glu-tRNA(Gln) amidotransferase subunit GatC [bacterium]NUN45913.1 Asp-tRNA(Asn)/Glu-tRNA(Gln) amidotransferase subunit GatC [bacterium]HMV25334.1 Asp-tRNA(Asn)/Glu-tRNA(Gln) amidotransferase subunit GatC [bacterium]HMW31856.1 Asp-tRNA(Asn)/Glu-tRNA(Gln) amidotransferase subunit GatC [bacterium]HMW36343.1 Asp-tRNA(Asn)/Glu-tRNA(Gln) amidotransferase subunit GatC [bacterium]
MPVTRTDVEKIASLAHLEFSDADLEKFTGQLNQILTYVEQLNTVDTTDVEPTYHPITYPDVFREDQVAESLPVDKVLANAPDKTWQYIAVPKVVG